MRSVAVAVVCALALSGCFWPVGEEEPYGGSKVITGWVFESTLRAWQGNWSGGTLHLLTDEVNTPGVERPRHCFLVELFVGSWRHPEPSAALFRHVENGTFRDQLVHVRAVTDPPAYQPPGVGAVQEWMVLKELVGVEPAPAGRLWAEAMCGVEPLGAGA